MSAQTRGGGGKRSAGETQRITLSQSKYRRRILPFYLQSDSVALFP